MYISSPEVAALAQTLQPTLPLFQTLEGYEDIQSAMAVLEAEESFAFADNQAEFTEREGPIPIPDEHHRVKYLGYFLTAQMDPEMPLKVALKLPSSLAHFEFHLLMRSFSLSGKKRLQVTHGITLQDQAQVAPNGQLRFEFAPLADTLKDPSKLTGFHVYLVKPPGQNPEPPIEEESSTIEQEPGIVRAAPKLNVYKKVDTRA